MKKWMILAAAILVVLGIGFAVKGASDKKQGATPEGTAVPETTTSAPNEETETANALREETETTETTETEDGAEEIDTLCGQITEINDEYLILEGTQQGTVQVNIFDDTLYNGSLQQGELAVGQYAEVIYDGKMTRSIPAQIAALAINVYPLKGTVDAVEEDGRVLVTPADGGEQVVLSLPDGVTMEAGETATFYTNGMATMSIPAQMNAIGVVK
ncbi:MAG: hypothetical protein ACLS6G_05995 [Christensenellales bacterium]